MITLILVKLFYHLVASEIKVFSDQKSCRRTQFAGFGYFIEICSVMLAGPLEVAWQTSGYTEL